MSFWSSLRALLLMAFAFIIKRFQKKSSKNQPQLPPGPVPWPIIGNIPEMLRNKPTFRWIHRLMQETKTDIFCIRFGETHIIAVSCPKIAREMLKQQDSVFASRPLSFVQRLLSSGNLTAVLSPYGDQWQKMKKVLVCDIISPARHRLLHDKRAEEADNLLTYVHNLSKELRR